MAGSVTRLCRFGPPRVASVAAPLTDRACDSGGSRRSMSRIAVLYPGGLGAALGRAIVRAGGTAITCLSGRSEATRHRAVAANFVVLQSLEEVARQSELVISLVSPTSALEAARCFADKVGFWRCASTNPRPIFVDLNSVSPQTKRD